MDNSRKKKVWSLAVNCFVIIAIAGLVIVLVLDTAKKQRPYTLSSKGRRTLDEKVQIIKPHFQILSKIEDIEYYCEVRPSSIGPSHYSDVIAIKIATSDIDSWLGNYSYNSAYDGEKLLSTIEKSGDILLKKAIWRHSSKPKVYVNGTKEIIVFQAEGILIIKRSN